MQEYLFSEQKNPDFAAINKEYAWAIEIVHEQFAKGIGRLCEQRFLDQRYKNFLERKDPIYGVLLAGMGDDKLAKTFVSYWTIGQSLATQSRFWLQSALARMVARQVIELNRERTEVYTTAMLAKGRLDERRTVYSLGETEFEHMTPGARWMVPIKTSILDEAARIVEEQERVPPDEKPPPSPRIHRMDTREDAEDADSKAIQRIAKSTGESSETAQTALGCNLLVVDPDKVKNTGSVYALRYINPRMLSNHAQRRQERLNLLRLYGYLVQERIFESPTVIRVKVAELLPRYSNFTSLDHYPDYFTPKAYLTYDKLWQFVGVPFDVVTVAIGTAAKELKGELTRGLGSLLPNAKDTKPTLYQSD
jgi:hypothetical protein